MNKDTYFMRYQHLDCEVHPGVEWYDLWSCACNGECPACSTRDIEPVEWIKASQAFVDPRTDSPFV